MLDRVINKIFPEPNSGCWLWSGAVSGVAGYGNFGVIIGGKKKTLLAHRYVYECLVGEIPTGMQIDHKCKNKLCVNPDHLDAVSQWENLRRSSAWAVAAARQSSKTHCPHGHPYDESNTYIKPSTGERKCRKCVSIQNKKYRDRE